MADYLFPKGRIAIFAKAPVAGQVKTRMQPALSPKDSAELQAKLIRQTINTALKSGVAPVQLWCSPDISHPEFTRQQQGYADRLELQSQQGDDLGQRMALAFKHNHLHDFTILIGTDCPLLTPMHLQQVASELQSHDVIFIPADDGGYVLIGGIGRPHCFKQIDWGTEKVLAQSLSALDRQQQSYRLLPSLPDLDHPCDLAALPKQTIEQLQATDLQRLAHVYVDAIN